ncbi:helix-turn-helix transcriptional regulator [Clostridium sp. C8-1-8]|uniref:helix-turn-helix domain-containing protein n=1 Tax=Clostridium sp. C8-1-8 TaxID=2698831 RepID=UPI00136B4412|nr:helix-turn-helix transcriptional regulator [Clostridium sp. C8-1-8]
MTIAERIVKVRTDEGLNQVDFARKLNLSKQTVSNYETGIRQPGLDIILKISDEFNISTDYLLGKSEYKTLDAHKLSTINSTILDTSLVNKLSEVSNENLTFIKNVFLMNGLDKLIQAIDRYNTLSNDEIDKYDKLLHGEKDSKVFKFIKTFDIGYYKKKLLAPLFDEAIDNLLSTMDKLNEIINEEED